jgi:transcriptional regulator with XRE-family HTH domain
MTPHQYRLIRKAIGLKQRELAIALDVTRETVCNRERGVAIISAEAAMALRWLAGVNATRK